MKTTTWRAIQGDATEGAFWTRLLDGQQAQALITDPPYCLLTRRRKHGELREPKGRKIENPSVRRFETVREFRTFTRSWLAHASAALLPSAAMVIWTNPLGASILKECSSEVGWVHCHGEFTWAKRTRQSSFGESLLRVVETALVLLRSPAPLPSADAFAIPSAVLTSREDDDPEAIRWGSHPNHKPYAVIEPLIRSWSRPGDLVVDPFAGSGSIGAVAAALGRSVATGELDPAWAALAHERLSKVAPSS